MSLNSGNTCIESTAVQSSLRQWFMLKIHRQSQKRKLATIFLVTLIKRNIWKSLEDFLEIPRHGKFYQGPGLKHTSDIFHVLSTQSFIIRSCPHMGGSTWHLQKQTNKRSRVHFFLNISFLGGQDERGGRGKSP